MEKLIELNEHCWHYRLIKFVWNFNPKEFKNLCPYFWLTIASIFVLPFVLIYKVIKTIVSWMVKPIDKMIDKSNQSYYQKKVLQLSNEDLYYLYNIDSWDNYIYKADSLKYFKLLRKFADKYPSKLEELLSNFDCTPAIKKSFKNKVDNLILKKRNKKTKKRMNEIANITKNIANFFLVVCIVYSFFVITNASIDLIIYLSSFTVDWVKFLLSLAYFIMGGLLGIVVFIAAQFTKKWVVSENKKWYYWTLLPLLYLFKGIGCVCKYIWFNIIGGILIGFKEGFREFGGIFAEYFSSSYSDYCPGITWKEEKE
jgi:hypothetical protein